MQIFDSGKGLFHLLFANDDDDYYTDSYVKTNFGFYLYHSLIAMKYDYVYYFYGDDFRNCVIKPFDNVSLELFAENSFDVTLVLGPMYHLYTEADKLTALREALRVTRRGGLLFVAYCQFDAAMIQSIFSGKKLFDYVTQSGLLDEETWLPISNPAGVFELYRKEDVDRLDACLDADRLHYVGTDMFTHYIREDIEGLDAALYEKYLSYTMSICENQNLVGVSNHTLDVLRKR